MRKKPGKVIAILLGTIVVLFAALFIALSIFNSPTYAWRLLRYGQSDIGDYKIFPERVIANGATIAEGKIGSVDDTVIKYIPEIVGRGLHQLTVRDLLLMNSGIKYVEGEELPFYYAPFADDPLTYYSSDLREVTLSVEADGTSRPAKTR